MLIICFEPLACMCSSGNSSLATVAPLSQELTHVSTDRTECLLSSLVRSENGIAIERTWTATVLSLVMRVNGEQRPYMCIIITIMKVLF